MASDASSPVTSDAAALRDQFVSAMSRVPLSVAVVVAGAPGERIALTVGTFISVSADPPMVLVAVKASSPLYKAVLEHQRFVINVLSAEQVEHSERFSGRPRTGRPYDLAAARWVWCARARRSATSRVPWRRLTASSSKPSLSRRTCC